MGRILWNIQLKYNCSGWGSAWFSNILSILLYPCFYHSIMRSIQVITFLSLCDILTLMLNSYTFLLKSFGNRPPSLFRIPTYFYSLTPTFCPLHFRPYFLAHHSAHKVLPFYQQTAQGHLYSHVLFRQHL